MTHSIAASRIAETLNAELKGENISVARPSNAFNPLPNSVAFLSKPTGELLERLVKVDNLLLLVPTSKSGHLPIPHIGVDNPRFAFGKTVERFFAPQPTPGVTSSARLEKDVVLGESVSIGEFSVIGPGVVIGDGTVIRNHVVIGPNVKIGQHCLIKSHAVIGEEGFGIEKDENGNNYRIPHIGSVIVGNFVEIGAFNSVASGTIDPTVVEDYVKCDDHVHIAHNCTIGRNTIITASATFSGSVTTEEDVWLAPNSSVHQGVRLKKRSFIGIGSVILKECEPDMIYVGCPGKKLKQRNI